MRGLAADARHSHHTAPAMVMLTYGAIIPSQSVEHRPLGQDHTVSCDAFVHCGSVAGCTGGALGSSCSTNPQLPQRHVALDVVPGGIHSWIVVPPIMEAMRPRGTGGADGAADAFMRSERDLPKYQHAALKRFKDPSLSFPPGIAHVRCG